MKRNKWILVLAIAAAALFVVACPMPQVGKAPGRDAVGGQPATGGTSAGSISVVNDTDRGVAVYINESGARFDVAATEYDGGPLVTCVDVSDFTVVAASTDADSLPVKAIVVGTRDDGSPGVWQINIDDTISLPQPEQTADNTARSIISGDMPSLPDGLQIRFGWTFKSTLTANGGKLIVGYAEHKQGFNYNGVQVQPGSRIAVYWRVSPLPYTRFCIVSSPHVIGILSAPPKPSWWPQRVLTNILVQLKQFLQGKFDAYIVTPESVQYDPATGNFTVKGLDDEGVTATARIDKNTVESIIEIPDLAIKLGSITFSPSSVAQGATLALTAVVSDLTDGPALPSTLSFYLSTTQTLDTKSDTFLGSATVPAIDPMVALDSPAIGVSASIPADLAAGTYYVIASVTADPADAESVTTNNATTDPTALAVTSAVTSRVYPHVVVDTFDTLTVGPIASDTPNDGGFPVPATYPVLVEVYSAADLTTPLGGDTARPAVAVNGFTSPAYSDFGYIDISNVPSGTYYVKVTLASSGDQSYALRVVTDATPVNYAGWVYTTATLPSLTATTTDGGPGSAVSISVGGKTAADLSGTSAANWYTITLP